MTALASISRTLVTLLSSLIAPRSRRRAWVLVVGLAVIALWQTSFKDPGTKLDDTYQNKAATGMTNERRFFFFLYHLGIYPLTTDEPIRHDTKNEAERLLRAAPEKLKQDEDITFRSGDRGRAYLFFVDAWSRHDAIKPSLRPANSLAFLTALLLLFGSFWFVHRPVFGFVLAVLLGSNPFQLYAVHQDNNIFSWTITALVLVLAIHVPLLGRDPPKRYPWIAAVVTGVLMATIRTVRSEPVTVLVSAMVAYVTLAGALRWKRAALVAVLLATFAVSNSFYAKMIQRKFDESTKVIKDVGGEPYEGPLTLYHEFWHAVYCGLGDFDTKYGYAWDDRVAYRYALPRLQAGGKNLDLDVNRWAQAKTYDRGGKYAVFFSETPGYHEIIRDKVLSDIKRDPGWYLKILGQRVWRILTETTPVTLSFKDAQYETKSSLLGVLCVPLLAFLVFVRRYFDAKLLLMSATTSASALLVFSGRGMTNYGCFHIVGATIFLALIASGMKRWLTRAT